MELTNKDLEIITNKVDLTTKDIELIKSKGLNLDKVLSQIEIFKNGIPFVKLESAATLGNGLVAFSDAYRAELTSLYESRLSKLETIKFVPASGAATRMFKDFFAFLSTYNFEKEELDSFLKNQKSGAVQTLLDGLKRFPFYKNLSEKINDAYPSYDSLPEGQKLYVFVELMLSDKGLNFGGLPKGLLPFHEYKDRVATAFEEHFYEAAGYNTNAKGESKLHFTISKNHLAGFEKEFERIDEAVKKNTKVSKFDVSYSFQKAETDTIAVSEDNKPFRKDDGSILYRPGGHGALIENLNDLDGDLVYIKNIDNVVTLKLQEEIYEYKKVLAGKLIEVQDEVFRILKTLTDKQSFNGELESIKAFLKEQLNIKLPLGFDGFNEQKQLECIIRFLNKPIRVCGMVKNEGKAGGGPFWIQEKDGSIVLQIIEEPQIDANDAKQQDILKNSTHFNPVDLVCGIRNYKGENFNLLDFVDPDAGFITGKSMNGRALKALELPGLWNGAMANWISIFVEVPLATFNPVKTVNDLLKPEHQM